MPISEYLQGLRTKVGHDLLLVPSVTAIVYDEQGRILLAKHAEAGVWVAPGGSVDPNESPTDAVVRETWEETGLLVEPTRVVGVYGGSAFEVTYGNGDRVTYLMTVFECQRRDGTMAPDGVETLDLAFVAEADLPRFDLASWARVVLPDVFRDRARTHFQPPLWRPPG